MKQSVKRLTSSILALVLVTGAFVIFTNLIRPVYGEIMELRGAVATLETAVASQRGVIEKIRGLADVYESTDEARQLTSLALPTSTMAAEALAQLNGLALIHSLAPLSYQAFTEEVPSVSEEARRAGGAASLIAPVSKVSFAARVVGSYADFKNFLNNLQTNVRIFDLKSASLQPAAKSNQDLYEFNLKVDAYYQTDLD